MSQGKILEVNQSALKMFGYTSAADILGRNVKILVPAPHAERHDELRHRRVGDQILGVRLTACAPGTWRGMWHDLA